MQIQSITYGLFRNLFDFEGALRQVYTRGPTFFTRRGPTDFYRRAPKKFREWAHLSTCRQEDKFIQEVQSTIFKLRAPRNKFIQEALHSLHVGAHRFL